MSHRTIREPSEEERAELKRIKREEIGRVAMRAHMMLLSDRGLLAFDIADLHDVTHPTVYKWIGRFDEEGPEGLFDREREGRPRGDLRRGRT
jgi:transposase